MKQTIKTKNYNAVVQIPYERIARKSNCINLNDLICSERQEASSTQTLIIPTCTVRCQRKDQKQEISMSMLEQLEKAFEEDIKIYASKVEALQKELQLSRQREDKSKQAERQLQGKIKLLEDTHERVVKQAKEEVKRLSVKVEQQKEQKEKMLKSKILQIQSRELELNRIQYERVLMLQSEHQRHLKDEISRLTIAFNDQKSQIREQSSAYRIQNQYLRNELLKMNGRNSEQVLNIKRKIILLEGSLEQSVAKERAALNSLYEKEGVISLKQRLLQDLTIKLNSLADEIHRKEMLIDQTNKKGAELKLQISRLQQQQERIESLHKKEDQQKKVLILKLQVELKEKQELIRTIRERQNQLEEQNKTFEVYIRESEQKIKALEQQLKDKDHPKLYEVKIEKVIDRKQYIESLEREVDNLKRTIVELSNRIKELQILVTKREKENQQKLVRIRELQQNIYELKIYIQGREKSFAWIVERQITKDIQINRKEQNRTYKVFPSVLKAEQNEVPIFPSNIQAQNHFTQQIFISDSVNGRKYESYFASENEVLEYLQQNKNLGKFIINEVKENS